MMLYLSEVLHRIGTRSKTMHAMFYLHSASRSCIIALVIRKKPRQYRGSRAGKSTVSHIHTIITNHEKTIPNFNLKQNVVLSNLLSIQPSKERHNHLCLAHVNAQSIRNKIGPFQHYLLDEKIDLCAITETWLKPDDVIHLDEIDPPGYDILSKPRCDGRHGGGVALAYKSSIKVNNITHTDQPTGLEYMNVHVKFRNKTLNLYIIYRYPNTSVLQFTETLANILESNILSNHGELILTGDFNIHMDKPHLTDTILFNDLLESFNLANRVAFPTHLSQHTIYLMLFEAQSTVVSAIRQGHLFSDHYFLHADLCIKTTKPNAKIVSYRKLKTICNNDLAEDLRTMSLQSETVEDLVTSYNSKLSEILDKHAPLKSCRLHKHDHINHNVIDITMVTILNYGYGINSIE